MNGTISKTDIRNMLKALLLLSDDRLMQTCLQRIFLNLFFNSVHNLYFRRIMNASLTATIDRKIPCNLSSKHIFANKVLLSPFSNIKQGYISGYI